VSLNEPKVNNIYLNGISLSIRHKERLVSMRDCLSVCHTVSPSLLYVHVRHLYRVIQEESAILWEMIVCVILSKRVHMNMSPILDGYRDKVKRRYGPSCEHEQQLRNK